MHKYGGHVKANGKQKFGKTNLQRACNFPYKGYKNSLYEGGTLSPAFIYSTKRQFASKRVKSIIHIMDWFPTILQLAKIPKKDMPKELDGVSQLAVLNRVRPMPPPRRKFIYGLINTYSVEDGNFRVIAIAKLC